MRRLVEPEILDTLPPGDAQAVGSRADLRRLNFLMAHAAILSRAFRRNFDKAPARSAPLRLIELGAGTEPCSCNWRVGGRHWA